MININESISPADLSADLARVFELAGPKVKLIARILGPDEAPVFTVEGRYTSRAWTPWTEGFRYGCALLAYEATGDEELLHIGRTGTLENMPDQITNFGVHDHGFQCISTFGTLLRQAFEGIRDASDEQKDYYRLALRCSGAVQARRWTALPEDGYIYSFNGPHSLFIDTIRTLRSLAVAHRLGQTLKIEGTADSLLDRLLAHARTTVKYNMYYGDGRDAYDTPGRVAHEAIFNINDGSFRCPSTQQGYSPFTTWTRGLAWAILGCAEQLEFLAEESDENPRRGETVEALETAARATAEFYIANTPTDGVPYWDTGAPGLAKLGDYLDRPAEPYNEYEPVDSSAAAIACQGLLRLGEYLAKKNDPGAARFRRAGLTVLKRLLEPPYLSESVDHQGLLLHGVYHRPAGWDHIPEGKNIPCGEAVLWGDYHLLEAALLVQRQAVGKEYLTFYHAMK
ncbi:MAG: glycoside hydrolase family 88 protein [Phycisphaerae bacterium]|nr:glycoside hydrolase family 88 protein [Phycisphaerae bacterium]